MGTAQKENTRSLSSRTEQSFYHHFVTSQPVYFEHLVLQSGRIELSISHGVVVEVDAPFGHVNVKLAAAFYRQRGGLDIITFSLMIIGAPYVSFTAEAFKDVRVIGGQFTGGKYKIFRVIIYYLQELAGSADGICRSCVSPGVGRAIINDNGLQWSLRRQQSDNAATMFINRCYSAP